MKPKLKTPLRTAFEEIYKPARLAAATPNTAYQYDLNLRRFDKALGRPALLADLNDATVNRAIAWAKAYRGPRAGGKPLSLASVEKFKDNIVAVWKYLHQRRMVDEFPSIPKIVVPIRIPTAWTLPELQRLWAYLERLPGDVAGVPANLWFLCLLSVLWNSGERIAPILSARWDQLDLTEGYLVCKAESRKGGLSDKLHKLSPETCALLRQIIIPEREVIFFWPWSLSMLYDRWREILQRAGLPSGRERMFHAIRKSVATHTKLRGGNACEALGHYDPKMTEQVYIDPRVCPTQHASDILPKLHKPKGGDNAA